jgi:hypothetical protein
MHTVEQLVPEPSSFEAEIAIEKWKRYKPPSTDKIPAELMPGEGNILHSYLFICLCIYDAVSS